MTPSGQVGLRLDGDRAGLSGLATCGSVWVCPVCAAKVATVRAQELAAVLLWAVEQGHTVAMMTLTVRHSATHPLAATWAAVTAAYGRVTSGRHWAGETEREHAGRVLTWENRLACDPVQRPGERQDTYQGRCAARRADLLARRPERHRGAAERWGLLGWVRAVEVTHGEHGWHPHLHVILVFEGEQTPECITRFGGAIWPAWERELGRHGYTALRDSGGLDIRTSTDQVRARLAAYFVKALACEATSGQMKRGRLGGRTPFQIARDLLTNGEARDHDLWAEYERASHGRRQLTWSRGLREMAGLARQETTDEEIAAEEPGGQDLLLMDTPTWYRVAPYAGDLLVTAERAGMPAARAWLHHRGLSWIELPVCRNGPP